MRMSSKKKVVTIVITTAALSLGSIGIASASNSKSYVKIKSTSTRTIANSGIVNPGIGMPGRPDMDGPNGELASVLASLVTKGTLTQAQVDAINSALTAARSANQAQGDAVRTARESLIATTLGITVTDLESELSAGKSLATIAGAKTDALIAALVAQESKEIDAAVAAGKITAAQATSIKANLAAHITAEVNGTGRGMGRMGEGRGRGPGMGAPLAGGTTAVTPSQQG